jgi:2'-5' RNA ligase
MRLFFALWPDAAAASRLAEAAGELAILTGGKPVPQAKIHLTLAFLGDLNESRLDAALQCAEGLDHAGLEVVLDQWGAFRGARVAWAGCRKPSKALMDLQADLADRLRTAGFVLEERAYTPHVTLARKVTRPIGRRDAEPVRWQATEVALVQSQLGKGAYSTLAQWSLGQLGPGPSRRLPRPG